MAEQKHKDRRDKDTAPAEDTVVLTPGEPAEIVGINFREAGKIYYFSPLDFKFSLGDRVIVTTSRGVEIGTVKVPNKKVDPKEIVSPLKRVMRPATEDDLAKDRDNRQAEMDAAVICKKKIAAHGLDMSLVAVEYTFDRSKLLFYFTCESRVDFRELVKDLASTFHTRIELRQIGIRDEAKIMGGLAICGRKYCCSGFLTDFVQVSIKMAKEQNFSLNSAKVSGACGRLMCCLRYEHEVYEEAIKRTPPQGSLVKTADGEGMITEIRPLAEEVRVKLNGNDKDAPKLYKTKDIRVIRYGKRPKDDEDDDGAAE
ncbi:MAG: stage 0 sporulation family protein [Clostridia bacterium]|nr:stage 0 sporulation family protein [Clostridia bacterium]